jgi:hypothetical protein
MGWFTRNGRSKIHDERGAIMLLAVFFAAFGVAMLYLAIGAGESVLFREHLQDAADSAALSGAVAHARMMNLLVLINLVMAALLAILVAIKTVETLAIIGIAIAAALAFPTFGASLVAIPPLNALRSSMASAYDAAKSPVFDALDMLKDAGDTISSAAPTIAMEIVGADVRAHEDEGVVSAGTAATTALGKDDGEDSSGGLPVTDDDYSHLCGMAGKFAAEVAMWPLNKLGIPHAITGALSDAMGELTKTLSDWFCDDPGNNVPELPQRDVAIGYPKREEAEEACKSSMPPVDPAEVKNYAIGAEHPAAITEPCQDLKAFYDAARPDELGNCDRTVVYKGATCGPGSPFEQVIAQARIECDPTGSPSPSNFVYQQQEMVVVYNWDGARWVRGTPEAVSSARVPSLSDGNVTSKPPAPCGPSEVGPTVAEGYNTKVHPDDDPNATLPVCSTEMAPAEPIVQYTRDGVGNLVQVPVPPETVRFTQVTNIFSCEKHEVVKTQPGNATSPGSEDTKGKAPKCIKKDAQLGNEEFQVRGLVLGNQQQRGSARLVRLGLWGGAAPGNPLEHLRELGGFAVAQAEYFYVDAENDVEESGHGGRGKWLWNMNWRARLKRFELPADADARRRVRGLCSGISGTATTECSRILNAIDDWSDLLVH